jgi:hypothetical protein
MEGPPTGRVKRKPVIALEVHPSAVTARGGRVPDEGALEGVNLQPYLTGTRRREEAGQEEPVRGSGRADAAGDRRP